MRTTEMVLISHFLKTSKLKPACISIYILSLPEPYLPEFLNRGLWFNSSGEQELINSLTLFYSPRLKHCSDLAFTYLKPLEKLMQYLASNV